MNNMLLRASRQCWVSSAGWAKLESGAGRIMENLCSRGQTVGVAETTSGGLISAALYSSPVGGRVLKGAGVRLAYGIDRSADDQ